MHEFLAIRACIFSQFKKENNCRNYYEVLGRSPTKHNQNAGVDAQLLLHSIGFLMPQPFVSNWFPVSAYGKRKETNLIQIF